MASDHRGFQEKQELISWLSQEGHEVVDCGDTSPQPTDDYVDFALIAAKQVMADTNSLGIVLCGSGVGMSIATNRLRGIYCALGFSVEQVLHARENDHVNMLSLPVEYIDSALQKQLIQTFLTTQPILDEKYIRRVKKLDSL
ncbi:MAG: RpiB/LacA/LacB family sugar-phosphate isomerase [Candidatus Roizmanbacteria bacterium]